MSVVKLLNRMSSFLNRRLLGKKPPHWTVLPARPPRVRGAAISKEFRVAVIGIGAQGAKQCAALMNLAGARLVAVADRAVERMEHSISELHADEVRCFDDAATMLRESGSLDLVSIATTAPSHLELARMAVSQGVPRVLIEKPIGTSLRDARSFIGDCRTKQVQLVVNYSRRWMPEYLAIKRCIDSGLIGEPKQISVVVGKGELAMHGSHYFDLCCFLLRDRPATAFARLTSPSAVNPRGPQFRDPPGYALFEFLRGGRSLVDFSADYSTKQGQVTVTGDEGRITIDERFGKWTLTGFGTRTWTYTFSDALKAGPAFARVVAGVLSGDSTDGCDGLQALEMIYGAWTSSRANAPIALPLPPDCGDLDYLFP